MQLENPLDLLEKGQQFHKVGKYGEAIEAFSSAIVSSPKYTSAFYSRGASYSKIGDSKNVINDLKAATKLGHLKSQEFLKSKDIAW